MQILPLIRNITVAPSPLRAKHLTLQVISSPNPSHYESTMFLIVRQLVQNVLAFDDEWRDRRSEEYPLLGVKQLITLLIAYYVFVKILGPKLMAKREPFDLRSAILVYNLLQVVACTYVAVRGVYTWIIVNPYEDFSCMMPMMGTDYYGMIELHLCYCYYLLKILDFTDTIFFVLRKRDRQVTFLHVYHHMLTLFGGFLGLRYLPGGHGTLLGIVNSSVHSLMYAYYFFSALRPEMKESLWWKKHLTRVQIVQFLILGIHYSRALFNADCKYPKIVSTFICIQSVVFTALFSDFYYKNYIRRSKNKTTQ